MNTRSHQTARRLSAALLGTTAILCLATSAGLGATHNLAADFNVTSNPNGVWRYGYYSTIGGPFTLMNTARTNEVPSIPIWSWSVGGISPPDAHYNAGTNTFFADGGSFPPGTLWICPGPESTTRNFGVMRFTVPAGGAGTYRIQTAVQPYLPTPPAGDTDFHVVHNGVELFGQFLAPQAGTAYSNSIALAVGDTIDFVIGRGQDNLLAGSCLKIAATVTSITGPPPPPVNDFVLTRDFSATNNPGGPWSYGSKSNISGPLTLLSYYRAGVPESWEFQAGVWPVVYHNNSTNTVTSQGGQGVFPPGSVWTAAGENGTPRNFSAIRFTVPAGLGGNYLIESRVKSALVGSSSSDADFHVARNGVELFGTNRPPSSTIWLGYTNTLTLAAGDTIDLLTGRGADGSQPGSLLFIEAWITAQTTNAPPPPPAGDYVLTRDYSPTNNPGGPWSYGAKPTLNGPLSLFGIRGTTPADGGIPIQYWQLIALQEPTIFHNGTTNTATITGGQGTLPPDTTYLISGTDGVTNAFGVVRFTAPVTGNYSLQASARPLWNTSLQGDTDYHVVRNGVELFGVFLSGQQTASYSNTLALVAGDRIDFMVGRGADNSGYASGLKLDAVLNVATNSPPPATNCVPAPSGLAAWWPFDQSAVDVVSGDNAVLSGSPGYIAGRVSTALRLDGVDDGGRAAGTSALDIGASAGLTIETWIRPENIQTPGALVEWSSTAGALGVHFYVASSSPGSLFANLIDTNGTAHSFSTAPGLVATGQWQHVALTYESAAGVARLFLNGTSAVQQAVGTFRPETRLDLQIGQRVLGGTPYRYRGGLDELTLYNRALTVGEIAAIAQAGSAGKCRTNTPPPPTTNCVAVPAGLVSWWRGEGSATDSVGTNHGVLRNGASFAAGRVGQGFSFNGAGQFVLVPDSATLDMTNAMTMELWFKADDYVTARPLFDKRDGAATCNYGAIPSTQYGLQLYYNDPAVSDGDFPGSGFVISAHQPAPTAGVFHHMAGTLRQVDPTRVEMNTYVDGVLVRSRTFLGSLSRTVNNAPLSIGAEGAGAGAVFKGVIDEVALYNRALSPAEVLALYNAGAAGKCVITNPPPPTNCIPAIAGLSSWLPLDGNAADVVGGGAGALSGSPVFTSAKVAQGLRFDGLDDSVRFPASASRDVGSGTGLTIEMWINPQQITAPAALLEWSTTSGPEPGLHLYTSVNGTGSLFANLLDTSVISHHISSAPGVLSAGIFQHVALTYDRASGLARLYVNAAQVAQASFGNLRVDTRPDLWLGVRILNGPAYRFAGVMDEISLYNRMLEQGELQAIYLAGAAGKCGVTNPPPPPPPTNCIAAALPLLAQLIADVAALEPEVNTRPLLASLRAAQASFERGSLASGIGQLHAFQNKVRAQVGRTNPALADELIAQAAAVIRAANCPAAQVAARGVNQSVRIESILSDAQSGSTLAFLGVTGTRYEVQVSENLVDWRSSGFAEEIAPGVFHYLDAETPASPSRFYRVAPPAELPAKTLPLLLHNKGAAEED